MCPVLLPSKRVSGWLKFPHEYEGLQPRCFLQKSKKGFVSFLTRFFVVHGHCSIICSSAIVSIWMKPSLVCSLLSLPSKPLYCASHSSYPIIFFISQRLQCCSCSLVSDSVSQALHICLQSCVVGPPQCAAFTRKLRASPIMLFPAYCPPSPHSYNFSILLSPSRKKKNLWKSRIKVHNLIIICSY